MSKTLKQSFLVGRALFHHSGFGVFKRSNAPRIDSRNRYVSASEAVEHAEALGESYAVYELVIAPDGREQLRGIIERSDLPVSIVP
ncbi:MULTISPECIES: hypothetical protein [unclassified Bradyrhizobium]|uniref:hypothetical protein n=1 Tax=unclassified Bradyrhizobium TaxID=2631580 RepID=UPI00291665A1|nr:MULTISPECIES: hypothetical protein [unclassified Bradyrhizobium]